MNQLEGKDDGHRYSQWEIPERSDDNSHTNNKLQQKHIVTHDYQNILLIEQWKSNKFQVSDPRKSFKFTLSSTSTTFTTKFRRILYEYDPKYSIGIKPSRYILFSNLPSSTIPSTLSTKLSSFGKIQSADILRNSIHGYCDGHALVIFDDVVSSNRLMITWKLGLLTDLVSSIHLEYDEHGSNFEKHRSKLSNSSIIPMESFTVKKHFDDIKDSNQYIGFHLKHTNTTSEHLAEILLPFTPYNIHFIDINHHCIIWKSHDTYSADKAHKILSDTFHTGTILGPSDVNSILSTVPKYAKRKRSHDFESNLVKKHFLSLLKRDVIHHIYTKSIFNFIEEQTREFDISTWNSILLPRQDILNSILLSSSSQLSLSNTNTQDSLIHMILEWMKSRPSNGCQDYNIILPSGVSRLESYKSFYSIYRAEKRHIKITSCESHHNIKEINSVSSSREKRATFRLLSSSYCQEDKKLSSLLKSRAKRLVVKTSSIHSSGLFTLDSIPSGDFVIEYMGEIIGLRVSEKREKQYGTLYGQDGCCYFFRIDGEYLIDATQKGNMARYINHSCDPNCIAKVVEDENGEKRIVFYTKKRISEGEEITYDYKFPKEDKKIPCHCGSKNCRGSLN